MSRRGYGAYGRRKGYRYADYHIPPLLDLAHGGTFTRGSVATVRTSASTLQSLGSNVRRITNAAYYGAATGGTGVVLEGSATQLLAADPVQFEAADGWTLNNASGSASLDGTHGSILDPFGNPAYQVAFGASANDRMQDSSWSNAASTEYTAAFWLRAITGTEQVRIGIRRNTSNFSANLTLTTTWQRFAFTATTAAGAPATPFIAVGNATDAAARSFLVSAAQAEQGAFPTSEIITASATRSADDLTFASIPVRMREGKWKMVYWPLRASGEGSGGTERLIHSSTPDSFLYGGVEQLQFVDGGTARFSDVKGWARLAKITHTIDMPGLTVDHAGYSSGNAQDTGAASSWVDASFRIGGAVSGAANFPAIYANPVAA